MRAADPVAAARAFVAAGAQPTDPANVARRAVRQDLRRHRCATGSCAAVRAGADAIGLNLVPGHAARADRSTRRPSLADARARDRPARHAGPRIVLVTVDRSAADVLADRARARRPDAIQLNGANRRR